MDALEGNSRLQACIAVAVRQQAQRRQAAPPAPQAASTPQRGLPWGVAALFLVAVCLFGWRLSAGALFPVEAPPSTVQLTNVHETHVPFPRLHARVTNRSGREVARAVWTVRYPETSPLLEEHLVVQDLKPGETREILAPFLGAPPPTHRMTERQILPLSVEWRS